MKRRIGCWIALAFTLALAIFVRCNDQFGFATAITIFVILPIILLPINIVASFDKKLLIEVPIISIVIAVVTELVTFPIENLGLHAGYVTPTVLVSAVAFTLTRFLKTKLVKRINDEIANNKTD
ncbi:hypothetical protein AXE76_02080 [Gardnerella vaginalis]|uniref:Uncharacterized protein n=1 Tax=Gardnerella vaginalis TaxID=2702 RepID=A0A3E1IPT3_GARVA|nr:hypothetical protein [Gardnerella vaginalis]RFD75015.1 hypothetical protein AXE76_02080 [Gardnerella vaginalis]